VVSILCSSFVEEGEEKGGDVGCTHDVRESACRGVSVLAMGSSKDFSSCDEAQL